MSAKHDAWVATEKDVPALLERLARFHGLSGEAGSFDAGVTADFLRRVMAGGVVFMTDRGCIGATLVPEWFNGARLLACELFWQADGGGLDLLRAFERWAADQGANEIRMASLAKLPRAGRLLLARGYSPAETSYRKELK